MTECLFILYMAGRWCILLAVLVLQLAQGLLLTQSKNMSVLNNGYYMALVNVTRVNAEYTPSTVSLDYAISNVRQSNNM